MGKCMRIVLLTNRDKSGLIKLILEEGFNMDAVIVPYNSNYEVALKPMMEFAQKCNLTILRIKHCDLEETLKDVNPDILLSAAYPFLLKPEHLRIAEYNINIHPTLLPKYRGPATAWHIIANGETETGVTVHAIDEGMDTGPIAVQEKVELTMFDTLKTAMQKATALEPKALRKELRRLKEGNLVFIPQDEICASTYTGIRTQEDSKIDTHKSIMENYNFIRACDPERFPAFFELQGQKVGIKLFLIPEE